MKTEQDIQRERELQRKIVEGLLNRRIRVCAIGGKYIGLAYAR